MKVCWFWWKWNYERTVQKNISTIKIVCVNRKLNLRIHPAVEKSIGHKLLKVSAVEESSYEDVSDDEETTESKEEEKPPEEPQQPEKTWEELQTEYLQQQLQRYKSVSQESLNEKEKTFEINLSKLFQESPLGEKSPSLEKNVSQDTLDVIDDLIKSFERESVEEPDDGVVGETGEAKGDVAEAEDTESSAVKDEAKLDGIVEESDAEVIEGNAGEEEKNEETAIEKEIDEIVNSEADETTHHEVAEAAQDHIDETAQDKADETIKQDVHDVAEVNENPESNAEVKDVADEAQIETSN